MKRIIIAALIFCIVLSLSACRADEPGPAEIIIKEDITEYSSNAAMAEALAAYANFIRENPYPCGSRDPKAELMLDNKLIKEYSVQYEAMAAAGAEKQISLFIDYGQEVLKLKKYADCDEFILFASGLDEINEAVVDLVNDAESALVAHEYSSAAEILAQVSDKYSEMLKVAESAASTERDMREITEALRELKSTITDVKNTIEAGFLIDALTKWDNYVELFAEYTGLIERAENYVSEIQSIEQSITALGKTLKL